MPSKFFIGCLVYTYWYREWRVERPIARGTVVEKDINNDINNE